MVLSTSFFGGMFLFLPWFVSRCGWSLFVFVFSEQRCYMFFASSSMLLLPEVAGIPSSSAGPAQWFSFPLDTTAIASDEELVASKGSPRTRRMVPTIVVKSPAAVKSIVKCPAMMHRQVLTVHMGSKAASFEKRQSGRKPQSGVKVPGLFGTTSSSAR